MTTEIVFDRRGSGEPLVLVHGIGSRWQVFQPMLDILAERFDVISLDLPGFGASPASGRPSVYGLADSVEKFCAELGLDRPHLAGNSMGGGIALELGARGLARSVTAFSPIGFWRQPGLIWCHQALRTMRTVGRVARPLVPTLAGTAAGRLMLFGLFFGKPTRVDPAIGVADVDGLLGATAFDHALASFRWYRGWESGALATIPVTIAWGSRDLLLTHASQSRRARARLRHARHVTLRGCGHLPFADDPAGCARLLLDQS